MTRDLTLTPGGRLVLLDSPDSRPELPKKVAVQLEDAFQGSAVEGLFALPSITAGLSVPATLVYWREFAQKFFQSVSRLGEEFDHHWKELAPPPDEEMRKLISAAPPMRGLEYLSPELLQSSWNGLREIVQSNAEAHSAGPVEYLKTISPVWHLVGRVTFHLAENKRDESFPFAFLATYTHRVSKDAKVQHIPLGQALKQSVETGDRERLSLLLEPVRRAADQSPLIDELLQSRAIFQPQAWNTSQAYRFLQEVSLMEAAGLVVRIPDWWKRRSPPRPQVQVRLGSNKASQLGSDALLDFEVNVALDGQPLTKAEQKEILNATDGLVLLRGQWVEANNEKLQEALTHWRAIEEEHPEGLNFIEGMRLLAGTQLDANNEVEETPDWSRIVAGDWLEETLKTLRDPSGVTKIRPGVDLNATLRPYQEQGVRWLWFLTKLGIGACLADDMGLGKTIQVIDLLLQLKRDAKKNKLPPSLLIVPSSLLGNWKQELERFAPSLKYFIAHRAESDADLLEQVADEPRTELAKYDLVITSYSLARRSEWLREMNWQLVILDEAQAIKNAGAAQTKAIKKLSANGRIVLTGTPIENHFGDLWSLFDFCCPGLLGSSAQFKKFMKRLNSEQDAGAFGTLRQLVQPYILRRLKTDRSIAPDLPEKTEMRTDCGLSKKQATLYQKTVDDLQRKLESRDDDIARKGMVLGMLMQLKQLCNHPAQFLNQEVYSENDSGKFVRLKQICEPIVERQEKMLIFTQFQSICEPLAEFLSGVFGRSGLVLTGKTPVKKRTKLVEEFQQDGGPPFFVISVKAGGSGLNLTAASHVVHFDRWWNPAVENQATDRAFRIGQKRNVLVHKFVCRGTLEERIDEMIREKQSLADQLLDRSGESVLTEMSDEELLKFVAIDIDRASVD